jgi:hypothetical protein
MGRTACHSSLNRKHTHAYLLALSVRVHDRLSSSSNETVVSRSLGVILDNTDIKSRLSRIGLGYACQQGQKGEKERKLHCGGD